MLLHDILSDAVILDCLSLVISVGNLPSILKLETFSKVNAIESCLSGLRNLYITSWPWLDNNEDYRETLPSGFKH